MFAKARRDVVVAVAGMPYKEKDAAIYDALNISMFALALKQAKSELTPFSFCEAVTRQDQAILCTGPIYAEPVQLYCTVQGRRRHETLSGIPRCTGSRGTGRMT